MSILTWRRDSLDRMASYEQAEEIRWVFREACRGAQVGIPVDNPIAGTAWSAPRVTSVSLGPPLTLRVQMPPGTEPAQLRRAGRLIAPHLYGRVLRVTDLGNAWCQVTVITRDPLDDPLPLNLSEPGLLLGRAEDGDLVELDHLRDLPHVIVQGQTRSGKSIFVYSLIAQCLREPDVLVCGVDPSGITLRPLLAARGWSTG
jgi:S-DNA-T family DNA segregation ATPase FtsK/SpoIIIE